MAGLALGAGLAARFITNVKRPILLYGVLEGIIAVTALLVPTLLAATQLMLTYLYGGQSAPVSSGGLGQTLFYLVATFIILGVPTTAMGATLPILSRYVVTKTDDIGPRIGWLYGINTLGAVFGTLIAAFLLLPYIGLMLTLIVGALVNGLIFVLAILLQKKIEKSKTASQKKNKPDIDLRPARVFHWVMPLIFVSGLVSFILEVFWTRLLAHIFGGTIYAFSVMLASFLFGIALGGYVAGRLTLDVSRAKTIFIGAQILTAVLSFLAFWLIHFWVPTTAPLLLKVVYAFCVITPSAFFIGASFPTAVRLATNSPEQVAHISGSIYAWNTVGAIFGSIAAGFFILPILGFGPTLGLAILLNGAIALACMVLSKPPRNALIATVMVVGLLGVFTQFLPRPDKILYAQFAGQQTRGEEVYYGVGRSATVMMRELDGFYYISSNGLSESAVSRKGAPPYNLSQKWLAGLPALARPNAKTMLVIGLGGGVALEGAPPNISEIDVIELEPEILRANQSISNVRNRDPLLDPRTNLILNDARNAIMLTDKKYDIIVSQPSHPWTGAAANLYTQEFLAAAKTHLNDDGVFLQWINSRFVDQELLNVLMKTIVDQYEFVELYRPEAEVLFFVASDSPIDIWDGAQHGREAFAENYKHYNHLGMRGLEDVAIMALLDNQAIHHMAKKSSINTDDKNRLAFFSKYNADGLTNDDLSALFEKYDPLAKVLRTPDRVGLDVFYITEQMLRYDAFKRAAFINSILDDPAEKATMRALSIEYGGDTQLALELYKVALNYDPNYNPAQLALLRLNLGSLAQQSISAQVAKIANEQIGSNRSVLEAWVFGASGDFEKVASLDKNLADVKPTSILYPIAVKLRVDWRIVVAHAQKDQGIAAEALEILDSLLANYWSTDLYLTRAWCGYLSNQPDVFVESVAVVVRQTRTRLKSSSGANEGINTDDARELAARLQRILPVLVNMSKGEQSGRLAMVRDDLQDLLVQITRQ